MIADDRLMECIEPDASSGCWLWKLSLDRHGYGQIRRGGRLYRAHRYVYEMVRGPIAAGLTLDHLCRVRACVNPRHMEAVPIGVNVLRNTSPAAKAARATHCPRGHPYAGDNLRTWVNARTNHRVRYCAACNRAKASQYYALHREEVRARQNMARRKVSA